MPKTGRSLVGMVAGFIPEWRPVFDRNGGRLHVGIRSWRERWAKTHPVYPSLAQFDCTPLGEAFLQPIFMRQMHDIILFALMPAQVQLALGQRSTISLVQSPLAPLLEKVDVSAEVLRMAPGRIFEAFFTLAELQPGLFSDCIRNAPRDLSSNDTR
ncbi:hypothetical protein [Mesorhizobium sp.]|uniref:hypothetical protein n=1 Tax=Mesorhizobium sp. TaxID=1871066 RepID=UPI000FE9770C|nr:hypothetical protein [Mesorhizobium sp.]RWK06718.1 MAG: hypothetical protein EOR39_24165 [Mesorhizobium sp.]